LILLFQYLRKIKSDKTDKATNEGDFSIDVTNVSVNETKR